MTSLLVWFWAVLLFASIAWYGFLVFYVGWKAGREILTLTSTLERRQRPDDGPAAR
jgi:hypothetical protein